MTLDDLLALLPDNSSGQISAADLRTVVTELWAQARQAAETLAYQWAAGSTAPTSGRISTDTWSSSATLVYINETAGDGQVLGFAALDTLPSELVLAGAAGGRMRARVAGPSVDQGTYRTVPIQVLELAGAAPANNEQLTVATVVALP